MSLVPLEMMMLLDKPDGGPDGYGVGVSIVFPISMISVRLPENRLVYSVAPVGKRRVVVIVVRSNDLEGLCSGNPISTVSSDTPVNVDVYAGESIGTARVNVVVLRSVPMFEDDVLATKPTSIVSTDSPENVLVYSKSPMDNTRVVVIVLRVD